MHTYSNDLTEYSLAFDYAESLIKADAYINENHPKILDYLEVLRLQAKKLNVYAVSFTEHKDLLSQWRGYCPGSTGFSIGFSAISLLQICPPLNALGMHIFPTQCVYEKTDIEQRIQSSLANLRQLVSQPILGPVPTIEQGTQMLKELLYKFAMSLTLRAGRFKHHGFKEENEWRLLVIQGGLGLIPQEMLGFHNGRFSPVPHVEIPLSSGNSQLELDRIIVGPSPHPDDSIKAVRMLLDTCGISCPEVTASEIPYRHW